MIRAGVLGAAGIAPQAFIDPVRRRDDMSVVAVAARDGAAARRFANTEGIPVAVEGYTTLLEHSDVDLVYIALPPSEHARWCIAALEAGKDVLCEKPISMSAVEAAAIQAAALRTGGVVIEAMHDHYHPVMAALIEIIRSGQIGVVQSITASFTADNPFSPTSLRHVPELGGGALMDLGCYPVHWVRATTGEEPLVESAAHTPGPLGADESITAELVTPSGIRAQVHASMAPGSPFSARFEAVGSEGQISVENLVLPHLGHSMTHERFGVSRRFTVSGRESYDHELDAVVNAVTRRDAAATGPTDFVANMRLMDAIYAAAQVPRPAARTVA